MSSLLDILHKRDTSGNAALARGRADGVVLRPTLVETPADPPPQASTGQPESEAPPLELRLAEAETISPSDATSANADPSLTATFGRPAEPRSREAPPTMVLAARPRKGPRAGNAFLAAGLVAIVAAAAAGLWLLSTADNQTMFATPPAAGAIAPAPGSDAATPAAAKLKSPGAAPSEPDPTWFDLPALPAESAGSGDEIRIERGTREYPQAQKLVRAYAAFGAGDLTLAESLYREVVAADPTHTDALLGIAAIAARTGRTVEAQQTYAQVLQLDPQNANATAALASLPGPGAAAVDDSRLKSLLREQPGAADLQFALGIRAIEAGRWSDAQLAFFEATRLAPENPDYAFNLAVSLDQLGQTAAAAAWYRRALDLARGTQLFDTAAAAGRLAAIEAAAG